MALSQTIDRSPQRKALTPPGSDVANKADAAHADGMVSLYRSILLALPDVSCRLIEVISAHTGEGVSTVVCGLAETASALGNARVLVCDATPERATLKHFGATAVIGTLNDVAAGKIELRQAMLVLPSRNFAVCAVSDPGSNSLISVNLDVFDAVFAPLRAQFDLILIDAPAVNAGPLGPALARKADGVIFVVEAERTRVPVIAAARRVLEVNGAHMLGVVLNKRRFHVPDSIYRWL